MVNPNYWGALPAEVRYSKKIVPAAKVLYAEIMSLCLKEGYCWATNQYFASLYGSDSKTISKWVSQLMKAGFVDVEIMDMFQRKIYPLVGVGIVTPHRKKAVPPPPKSSTPTAKKEPKEENKEKKLKDIATPSEIASSTKPKRQKTDPIDLNVEVDRMLENKARHIQIIGAYVSYRLKELRPKITNYGQLSELISRHLRYASKLTNWSDEQLNKAFKEAEVKNKDIDWTLETIYKHMTK